MIYSLAIYRPLAWIEAPTIPVDLLWGLGLFFGILGAVYFLLIFWLRNRISRRKKLIIIQKRNLAPMISNFLFFNQDEDVELREDYIRMKLEIREQLKSPLNRKVMTEVLMDLRMDVSGKAKERLLNLYQDLGLDQDAFQKLESWRWERVSQGILELTEMQVEKSYAVIRKFINDRRSVIRKQAQLASVSLKQEGINYFLDTAKYRISEWQQLKLLEVLRAQEDFIPPRFKAWLTSENRDVVLFALRLIRHYRQNDAEAAIITLLRHKRKTVQLAAIDCIKEFRFAAARPSLIHVFDRAGDHLKVAILDAMRLIGTPADMDFLSKAALKDGSFIVRSKAKAVMNDIVPDSALPTADLYPIPKDVSLEAPVEEVHSSDSADPSKGVEASEPKVTIPEQPIEIPANTEELQTVDMSDPDETPEQAEEIDLRCDFSPGELHLTESNEITEEELAIFDLCLWQELNAILEQSEATAGGAEIPDFLPKVDNEPENPLRFEPWLFDLRMQPEAVTSDTPDPNRTRSAGTQKPQSIENAPEDAIRGKSANTTNLQPPGKPSENPPSLSVPYTQLGKLGDWLLELEVEIEYVACEESFTPETAQPDGAFCTDFVPLVIEEAPEDAIVVKTPRSDPDMHAIPLTEKASDSEPALMPLFELWEASSDRQQAEEETKTDSRPDTTGNAQAYSIFREFFRNYDTESKLILMEQIPDVGEEKEWEFLRSLQQDENIEIRQQAKKLTDLLGKRLWGNNADQSTMSVKPKPATQEIEGLNFTPERICERGPEKMKVAQTTGPVGRWAIWPFTIKKQHHE